MKTNYETPQIEVIDIEVEDVLCQSGDDSFGATTPGSSFGNRN